MGKKLNTYNLDLTTPLLIEDYVYANGAPVKYIPPSLKFTTPTREQLAPATAKTDYQQPTASQMQRASAPSAPPTTTITTDTKGGMQHTGVPESSVLRRSTTPPPAPAKVDVIKAATPTKPKTKPKPQPEKTILTQPIYIPSPILTEPHVGGGFGGGGGFDPEEPPMEDEKTKDNKKKIALIIGSIIFGIILFKIFAKGGKQ